MPLTPFHSAVTILGFIWFDKFYIPALVVSSMIMDIEPIYYWFIDSTVGAPHHGFFHTYIGVTIIALVVAFLLVKFRKQIDSLTSVFALEQKQVSTKWIYASSLIAAWSHVFFDSFMHTDIKPLWPLTETNPLLKLISNSDLYLILGLTLFAIIILFAMRYVKQKTGSDLL